MPQERKNKQPIAIFVIVGVLAGLLIGGVAGYALNEGEAEEAFRQGVSQGREELEKEYAEKLEEVFPSPVEPEEVYSLRGKITSIEGGVLNVKQETHFANPLKDPQVKTWQVEVTDETELVERIEVSPEELEEAGEEPAEPFKETEISFSEFEEDDEVFVRAGENIKGKEGFKAQKIVLESTSEEF